MSRQVTIIIHLPVREFNDATLPEPIRGFQATHSHKASHLSSVMTGWEALQKSVPPGLSYRGQYNAHFFFYDEITFLSFSPEG